MGVKSGVWAYQCIDGHREFTFPVEVERVGNALNDVTGHKEVSVSKVVLWIEVVVLICNISTADDGDLVVNCIGLVVHPLVYVFEIQGGIFQCLPECFSNI